MSDHYVAYMESEIRQLRLERELLHAKAAQFAARADAAEAEVVAARDRHEMLIEGRDAVIDAQSARADAAEAAIERVRELHRPEPKTPGLVSGQRCSCGAAFYLFCSTAAVLDALDGGA